MGGQKPLENQLAKILLWMPLLNLRRNEMFLLFTNEKFGIKQFMLLKELKRSKIKDKINILKTGLKLEKSWQRKLIKTKSRKILISSNQCLDDPLKRLSSRRK